MLAEDGDEEIFFAVEVEVDRAVGDAGGLGDFGDFGVEVAMLGEDVDGRWEELKDCSIILSRYGVADQFSGTVAVIASRPSPIGGKTLL